MNREAARGAWWLPIVVALAAGCMVDEDKPCDENQTKLEKDFFGCVCVAGTVPNKEGNGCVPCGANEQETGGACACIAGYRKPAGGTVCAPIPEGGAGDAGSDASAPAGNTGDGAPCTSAADCANFDATYCQMLAAPNVCLVQGCGTGARKCSAEQVCCSSPFFPGTNGLCFPAAACSQASGTVLTP